MRGHFSAAFLSPIFLLFAILPAFSASAIDGQLLTRDTLG
jgi:hypothetical protein